MPLYRTEAIALHDRPGNDADKWVTLFTAKFGQVLVKAAGLARSRSRYGSAMELLSHTDVLLHKKNEPQPVYRLTQCTLLSSHAALRGTLPRIAAASMVAEGIAALTLRDEPQPLLWALLLRTIDALERHAEPRLVVICYLCHLMRCTGYWPSWERCAISGKEPAGPQVFYWPEQGGIVDAAAMPRGHDWPAMRLDTWRAVLVLSTAKLAALPSLHLGQAAYREIWRVFDCHWRAHIEWRSNALHFLQSIDGLA